MAKSLVYAVNTVAQSVASGGTVNFGSVITRTGCEYDVSNGNLAINGVGVYAIDTNITFLAGAAGTAEITAYVDGVPIDGATVSITVDSGSTYTVSIPAAYRGRCPCARGIITVVISGVASTVSNAAIMAEKM